MPTISAPDLATLRQPHHRIETYASILRPRTLLSANVNNPSIALGETIIDFDSGIPVNESWVEPLQEVWIGTSAGLDDVGRVRIRAYESSDGGLTGKLTIPKNSIHWVDNLHLTFLHNYPLKPLYPFLEDDGTFKKDGDIPYSNQNSAPPPVVICGSHRAGFLSAGSLTFPVDMSASYPIAQGGTIHYRDFTVTPSIGWTRVFNTATGIGTITFTTPGQYWLRFIIEGMVGLTVVEQISYRSYFVHDPDPTSEDYPLKEFTLNGLEGDWDEGGWQAGITLSDNASLEDIPDKTLVVAWGKTWYNDVENTIGYGSDDDNTLICGYIRKEKIDRDRSQGSSAANFDITTIDGLLRQHYMFSVSLEASQTVDRWYKYASWLTVGRAIHHFWKYHSTLLEVADVFGLTTNTDGRAVAELEDGNLYSMADSLSRDRGIRSHVVCDRLGRMRLSYDAQLLPDDERTALPLVAELEIEDQSGKIVILRQKERDVPFVHASGFAYSGTFDGEGKPNPNPICAVSPGETPDDEGPTVVQLERQVLRSQTHANQIAGRVLAAGNKEYPEFRMTFHGNYLGYLEPAFAEYWTASLQTTETAREIIWADKHLYLRNVSVSVSNGRISCNAIFEPDAPGEDGVHTDCPTFPDAPGEDPPIPEEEDLPGAIVTGSSVRYLPLGGDWLVRTAQAVLDVGADPFWREKQNSDASADAILWACGAGFIWRSPDAGVLWQVQTPGDPPGGTFASCEVIRYEGSWVNQDEQVFLVRQEISGSWVSWLLVTPNDGDTWNWYSLGGSGGVGWGSLTQLLTSGNTHRFAILSSTKIVHAYSTPVGDSIFSGYLGYLVVGDINGNVITYGTPLEFYSGDATTQIIGLTIKEVDSTRFILAYDLEGDPISTGTHVQVYSVSGTTMTPGTEVTLSYALLSFSSRVGHNRFLSFATDKMLYITMTDSTEPPRKWVARVLTLSGTTISSVGSEQYINDALHGGSESEKLNGLIKLSSDKLVMAYQRTGFGSTSKMTCCDVSGDTVTPGTHLATGSTNYRIVRLDDTHFLAANTDLSDVLIATVAGTTISLGASNNVYSNCNLSNLAPISDSAVAAIIEDTSVFPSVMRILFFDVSIGGDTVTVESESPNAPSGLKDTSDYFSDFRALNSTSFVYGYAESDSAVGVGAIIYGASSELKGLGLSVGKSLGDLVYITAWDGGNLRLLVFSLIDEEIIDDIGMGGCSETELSNNQKAAYPYTTIFSDDECYVFGRMDAPAGRSSIHHVLYSVDGAVTLDSIESGFGADLVTAVTDGDGETIFIRSAPLSGAKLYGGIESLSLKTTLTFPAGVRPMALAFDWFNQRIYAAADRGNSIMVIYSDYPYTSWKNITLSHGTGAGVWSVVVL